MPNKLLNESSLYLKQHAHNPVNWYPWGEEAFQDAMDNNKPVLISIGYSACHWCHVMERESFEDAVVAAFMNEHFVCIKVDREEHPDVDHLYMDALIAMSGAGGWPLNIFVTPEKKPFYGGTYFPPQKRYGKASWIEVLEAIQSTWTLRKEEVDVQADQLTTHLEQAMQVERFQSAEEKIDTETIHQTAQELMRQADAVYGGFGGAPKFPSMGAIRFLLEYYHYNKAGKNKETAEGAKQQALLSINKLLEGGIYDQLGGGIARYATDKAWLIPHFEKMLYDNALFISLLADTFRLTHDDRYRTALEETIAFCRRDLRGHTHPGFYSALDADSEGEEGKYYTWTMKQWEEALGKKEAALVDYFGIEEEGNWEHTNILSQVKSKEEIMLAYKLSEEEWYAKLSDAKRTLLSFRTKRVMPATDDKVLLSWNALMNKALVDASLALEDKRYLEDAESHMQWLLYTFAADEEGRLYHVHTSGKSRIEAKLDDYAYLSDALLTLASATGNTAYITKAQDIVRYVLLHFRAHSETFFYFSSDRQRDILIRKIDTYDGATPSANVILIEQIRILGNLMGQEDWIAEAESLLLRMRGAASRYPLSFAYWATALQRYTKGYRQLIIAGPEAFELRRLCAQKYLPEHYIFAAEEKSSLEILQDKFWKGETRLYVCNNFSCQPPVYSIADLPD